jgi:F0F1-type ATP synthase delta subunit
VRTNIDPAIGGGLVIKVDGRVIDGSVRNTLQKLKYRLTAN